MGKGNNLETGKSCDFTWFPEYDYTASQQFRHPSLAEQQASDSDRGWKHQPEPNNQAISRHINNSRDKKLQFCMMRDKYHKFTRKRPSCFEHFE